MSKQTSNNYCLKCGYSLIGLSLQTRCPECGTDTSWAPSRLHRIVFKNNLIAGALLVLINYVMVFKPIVYRPDSVARAFIYIWVCFAGVTVVLSLLQVMMERYFRRWQIVLGGFVAACIFLFFSYLNLILLAMAEAAI